MHVLFGSVDMTIKRVQLNLVRNMGLCCLMQLAHSSPQKKPNTRAGSEHAEGIPFI